WNGGDQNTVTWDSSNVTWEDLATFGHAGSSIGDNGNVRSPVYRRVWASWDGFCPPGPTTMRTIYVYGYLQDVPKPQERSHLLSENSIYRWDARQNLGCSNGYGAGGSDNESWSAGIYQRDVYDDHVGALDRFFHGITFSIKADNFPMPACGLN